MTLRLDGHGNLPRQQSREFEIELVVDAWFIAPEVKDAQSIVGGRQRKTADCLDRMIEQSLREGEAIFQVDIVNDNRLLVLPNPARDRPLHRDFCRSLPLSRRACFEEVQPHHVSRTIMKHHTEVAKVEQGLQSAS